MMADAPPNNDTTLNHKRLRRSSSSSSSSSTPQTQYLCKALRISDLPDESLEDISKYLLGTSRALFAVAMTFPSISASGGESPWKSPKLKATNQAILSMRDDDLQKTDGEGAAAPAWWTRLSFCCGGSGYELALKLKLSDNDLHAALICMDAVNRLEALVLTSCVSITGSGLKPLEGSTVLKEVDLFTAYQFRSLNYDSSVRADPVIPILTSIIDTPRNSLRTIILPDSLREKPVPIVHDFQNKFAELLEAEGGYNCPECGRMQKPRRREDEDREFCVYNPKGTQCTGYYCVWCYVRLYDRCCDY